MLKLVKISSEKTKEIEQSENIPENEEKILKYK
jgi:hypothetical protein